jgi:hypothetical protein
MPLMQAASRAIRLATVAIAFALSGPAAYAQQPSAAALASAKEVVDVTSAGSLFNPLIAGVIEQARILFLQQNPALNKDLTELATKMRTDLAPRLEELKSEVARLYATSFNEQELKDILAFYKSPAGKKLLQEQPNIVENSMKFAQDWANKLSDQVIGNMRDEMRKKGHAL